MSTCPHCHPHCTKTEHSNDCIFCECRKTRPIVARKVRVELGRRYMLRQGRAVPGQRRVGSGEIVTVIGQSVDGSLIIESHDGIVVRGIEPIELGRNK